MIPNILSGRTERFQPPGFPIQEEFLLPVAGDGTPYRHRTDGVIFTSVPDACGVKLPLVPQKLQRLILGETSDGW
jgi:hypothetical protein